MMPLIISTGKRDLTIRPICMNVAGTLGFSDETKKAFDLSNLGALITNPISLTPRIPARPPRVIEFQGGFLLHTGHPNPGFTKTLLSHSSRWNSIKPPIIVHLLVQELDEASYMLERLEDVDPVAAVEIGLGDIDANSAAEILSVASRSELPIIANAPLNADRSVFLSAAGSGAGAISLGPPRGTMLHEDGSLIDGRIFGPSLIPLAVRTVASIVDIIEIPIIASGGIYQIKDVEAMMNAGAAAVQLDSVLWTDPGEIFSYFHNM